ncbi:uncharacterized protein N7506_007632 [Penicillium brevicompactum]|uniref:uncharacterized protein n=1 Tax=Penicillium brevicompactum TaxID=5074 RepID=UPI00253F7645|nr:uncharacterized protein N7506_007632 [Penicillium brevicompactum]KAJ5333849.1 hypothetical protein N7506_007632 [Penicillium brevicompactum]
MYQPSHFFFFLISNPTLYQPGTLEIMTDDKNNNRNDRNRNEWHDEANPFVAFRRYADEQVSTLLQSITGLPSAVTPPHNDRWEIFTEDHGYESRGALQRTGNNSDRDRQTDNYRGGDRDSEHHPKRWYNGPSDFFGLDSFLLPLASHLFHSSHSLFPDMFEDPASPTWPIAYIMFSPYSPLHLERQAHYHAHRDEGIFSSIMSSLYLDSERDSSEPQWREAFEDLLRLENGKPMLNRDPTGKSESGKDWLHGLVKRGSLGDQWRFVPGTENQPWSGITFAGHQDQEKDQSRSRSVPEKEIDDVSTSADTELELYERFLSDIENREREFFSGVSESPLLRLLLAEKRQQQEEFDNHRSGPPKTDERSDSNDPRIDLVSGGNKESVYETPHGSTESSPDHASDQLSRVVSTMTRTERVQLPDGSVKSTIVKTKRFADGREEEDSSVEVSHPQHEASDSQNSKNGWFWKD